MNEYKGKPQSDDSIEDNDKHTNYISQDIQEENPKNLTSIRSASMNILNHVKLNEAIQTHFSSSKQTQLNFSKENLKKIEKQLKQAFIEFYQKLTLLKNYR